MFAIQQEDTRSIAIEQVSGLANHQVQQRSQIPLRIHFLADGKQGGEFFMQFRLHRPHDHFSLSNLKEGVY